MKNFLISILPIILAVLVVIAITNVIDITWPIAGLIGAVIGGGSGRVIDKILKNKNCKEV